METRVSSLERALVARVSERIRTAGEFVDPAVVEHIVREVVERLGTTRSRAADPGTDAERALLVLVVDAPAGPGELATLESALRRAAGPIGARVLAAHAEPFGAS